MFLEKINVTSKFACKPQVKIRMIKESQDKFPKKWKKNIEEMEIDIKK